MNPVSKAILNLANNESKLITNRELKFIEDHKEEASVFFHTVLEMMRTRDKEDYLQKEDLIYAGQFALFFLAEWKDTTVFRMVGEILARLGEDDDRWLGDILTENLPNILYQLYDGNAQLLAQFLYDTDLSPFARVAYEMVAIQLYLDQRLSLDDLLSMLRHFETFSEDELDVDVISFLCDYMARAHIPEYLPDIRKWINRGWVSPQIVGSYADHLDLFYDYRNDGIIRTDYSIKKEAGYWYKFEDPSITTVNEALEGIDDQLLMKRMLEREASPYKGAGRNDPCPCGSGKKFKKCCLPLLEKQNSVGMEPPLIRYRKARYYPKISFDPVTGLPMAGFQRVPGYRYLEDQYGREAITVDYYVYLARETVQRRSMGEMIMDGRALEKLYEGKKKTAQLYLDKARELRSQIMDRDNLPDLDAYDRKYAIHFCSDEWAEAEFF